MPKINIQILNPYSKTFYLIQLALWILYGVIFRLIWIAYDNTYTAPQPLWFIVYVSGGYLFTTLLAFIYWKAKEKPFHIQFITVLIGSAIAGVSWRIVFNILDYHVIDEPPRNYDIFFYVLGGTSSVIQLLAWSSGYLLIAYYLKYTSQRERAIIAELQAKEAQIKQLHQQISPHFLFNVLHSLDTLLLKKDTDKSRKMISKLGQYLRHSLEEKNDFSATLSEEIQNSKNYLEIEQVRFGDKLNVKWQLDSNLSEFRVPSLILQPLIENAIKHSIDKSVHGGQIEIKTEKRDQTIKITVQNESMGTELQESSSQGLGIGIENIKARLDVYYGDNAKLITKANNQSSFTAQIEIIEND